MTLKPFKTQDGVSVTDNSNLVINQSTVGWITIYGPLINNDDDRRFECVAVDSDGNSYFGGYDSYDSLTILVKFDPAGTVLWSSSFGSEGSTYPLRNIRVNETNGQLEVVLSNMVWRVSMADGSLINTFAYSESNAQLVELYGQAQLGNSKVLVGLTEHPTLGPQSLVITPTWSQTFGSASSYAVDYAQNVATVGNDLIVVVGTSNDTEGFTNSVATVTAFNADGTLAWAKILNENNVNCNAISVATTSDRILVTHYNDDTSNCYLTCLDLDGNAIWQCRTDTNGRDESSVAVDAQGGVYWLMQSYWDEFGDDAYKIVKLDIEEADLIWTRWAGNRNDCRLSLFQPLAVGSNSIYVAGNTDDTDNNYDTSFAMRLPADGGSTGYLGYYFWAEGDYDVYSETATITTWTVAPESATITSEEVSGWSGGFYLTDNNIEPIRNQTGGRLIFGDGSQQTTSATDIAQLKTGTGTRRLGMGDRGKHIYCTSSVTILVPYDYDVAMPIGSTVVIVNNSGGNITIAVDGGATSLIVPGLGNNPAYDLSDQGMATLLKVDTETWFMTGVTLTVGGF